MAAASKGRFANRSSPVPAFYLYGEAPEPPDEGTVHVETIAARSLLHDWTIQPHRHRDLYQILVLQVGGAGIRLDGHAKSLRSPGIVVVPPGVVHSFRFEANTVGLVASFAGGLMRDLAGASADFRAFFERSAAVSLAKTAFAATDLEPLCALLLREFGRAAPGRESALRGLLSALAANVYRIGQQSASESCVAAARERELVARFRASVERQFRNHATVARYCRSVGVSQSQLRRACLAVTGQSPIMLVHLRMLVEAERQLRYTAMPVTQVAYYLGYQDPAYFTRFFSRRTGLSPKRFRERDARGSSAGPLRGRRQRATYREKPVG